MSLEEPKDKSNIATIERDRQIVRSQSEYVGYRARALSRLWQKLSRLAASSITQALILLLVLNAVLNFFQPFSKVDPLSLPATHTWAWWATREFSEQKVAPPVVLAGSSLVMHSVSRQDANYLGKDIDYVRHHYSSYFSDLLRKRYGANVNTMSFNFALPGSLVSDDYMVARALFHGAHKPKYVFLGLSLRDFIDNAVNCPGTTPPFRYFRRFGNTDDLIDLSCPMFWQQFDYRFGQFFYLWGRKLDLQTLANDTTKNWLSPRMQQCSAPSLLNGLDYRKHVPNDLHSEVEEGMAIVQANQPYSFDLNYADYRRRCGRPNEKMFQIQTAFLTKLIALCKSENIQLILVNMPLTSENLAIMPSGVYEHYLQTLKDLSISKYVRFVDLNGDPRFTKADFYDTAHMNASGGKKFLDALAQLDDIQL